MERWKLGLILVFVALISVSVTATILPWTTSSKPLERYGFVDVDEIVRKDPYFRNAQQEWTRDRRRLRREYLQQLRGLDVRANLVTSLMNDDQTLPGDAPPEQGSIHQHGRDVSPRKEQRSVPSGILRTIMTRKLRVERVMRRKQKEINREGRQRIRKAIEQIARRRGITRVFERGDLLYERNGSRGANRITDSRDITGAVLKELSSGS